MTDEDRIVLDWAALKRLTDVVRRSSEFVPDVVAPESRAAFVAGWNGACRALDLIAEASDG